MSLWVWAAVAGVGGCGASARFLLDASVSRRAGRDFPLGTLVVNLSGTFGLGLLTGLALTGTALLIAGTATIGSFTTFSTWMLESQRLVEDGEVPAVATNVVLGIVAGVGAAALGRLLGARL